MKISSINKHCFARGTIWCLCTVFSAAFASSSLAAADFPTALHGEWYSLGTAGQCAEFPTVTIDASGATYEAGYCKAMTVTAASGVRDQWRIELKCGAEGRTRDTTAAWGISKVGGRRMLMQFEHNRNRFSDILVECRAAAR